MKDINPKTTIIQGGIHASLMPEEILAKSPVDIVALTEFDLHIAQLTDHLRKGLSLEKIPNIAYRNEKNEIITTERVLPIQNIDETLHPVREIHTVGENKPTIPALMPMITSRGCPYNCYFLCKIITIGT